MPLLCTWLCSILNLEGMIDVLRQTGKRRGESELTMCSHVTFLPALPLPPHLSEAAWMVITAMNIH